MRDAGKHSGFTLIEVMIAVAIVGILAVAAIPSYQRYTIRAQVTEGINMASPMKKRVMNAFMNRGEAPLNRKEAGMTVAAEDTSGSFVKSVDVQGGVIVVTFGNEANAEIHDRTFTMTPYETEDLEIVWRCGTSPAPAGLNLLGTAGGGETATYIASSLQLEYLPATCRL